MYACMCVFVCYSESLFKQSFFFFMLRGSLDRAGECVPQEKGERTEVRKEVKEKEKRRIQNLRVTLNL